MKWIFNTIFFNQDKVLFYGYTFFIIISIMITTILVIKESKKQNDYK